MKHLVQVLLLVLSHTLLSASVFAVNFGDVRISDVSAESFTLTWQSESMEAGGVEVEVFADVQASEPVANAKFIQLADGKKAKLTGETSAAVAGLFHIRIAGLNADTPYFFRLVYRDGESETRLSFPKSGALPSIKTQRYPLPFNNDSIPLVVNADNSQSTNGSVVLLQVAGAQYPISALVGADAAEQTALLNLSNLYTLTNGEHLAIVGGEGVTLSALGASSSFAQVQSTLNESSNLAELSALAVDDIELSALIDSDTDGLPNYFENQFDALNPLDNQDANLDSDNDGLSNLEEFLLGTAIDRADSDEDGLSDGEEANYGTLPQFADTDRDGRSDGAEVNSATKTDPLQADSDGDGVSDGDEISDNTNPNDGSDYKRNDYDNDGVADSVDNCLNTPNSDQSDLDRDGLGNACDDDDDGDGIPDAVDNAPLVANADQVDSDEDGVGDVIDNCPLVNNPQQRNNDNDLQGDACDPDDDNDTINDWQSVAPSDQPFMMKSLSEVTANLALSVWDNRAVVTFYKVLPGDNSTALTLGEFYFSSNRFIEAELSEDDQALEGILVAKIDSANCFCFALTAGDSLSVTSDAGAVDMALAAKGRDDVFGLLFVAEDGSIYDDRLVDTSVLANLIQAANTEVALDNCQFTANSDQLDTDNDGAGDVCDSDIDGDNIENTLDNCPLAANPGQEDENQDNIGDACDNDIDDDLIDNELDNCPAIANPNQEDQDEDGRGDVCDADRDGDNVDNAIDNCPAVANPEQIDIDEDNIGDACDDNVVAPFAELVIETPLSNRTVNSSIVTVAGRYQGENPSGTEVTNPIVKITINGVEANLIDAAYRGSAYASYLPFHADVELVLGANTIEVVAEDTRGELNRYQVAVNYQPKRVVLLRNSTQRLSEGVMTYTYGREESRNSINFREERTDISAGINIESDVKLSGRGSISIQSDITTDADATLGLNPATVAYDLLTPRKRKFQRAQTDYEFIVVPEGGTALAVITSPANGSRIDQDQVVVQGFLSDKAATLTVDGQAIQATADGEFSIALALAPGWNEFNFVTTNDNGAFTQIVRYKRGAGCVITEGAAGRVLTPTSEDSDGDGFSNTAELRVGTDPTNPNELPCLQDSFWEYDLLPETPFYPEAEEAVLQKTSLGDYRLALGENDVLYATSSVLPRAFNDDAYNTTSNLQVIDANSGTLMWRHDVLGKGKLRAYPAIGLNGEVALQTEEKSLQAGPGQLKSESHRILEIANESGVTVLEGTNSRGGGHYAEDCIPAFTTSGDRVCGGRNDGWTDNDPMFHPFGELTIAYSMNYKTPAIGLNGEYIALDTATCRVHSYTKEEPFAREWNIKLKQGQGWMANLSGCATNNDKDNALIIDAYGYIWVKTAQRLNRLNAEGKLLWSKESLGASGGMITLENDQVMVFTAEGTRVYNHNGDVIAEFSEMKVGDTAIATDQEKVVYIDTSMNLQVADLAPENRGAILTSVPLNTRNAADLQLTKDGIVYLRTDSGKRLQVSGFFGARWATPNSVIKAFALPYGGPRGKGWYHSRGRDYLQRRNVCIDGNQVFSTTEDNDNDGLNACVEQNLGFRDDESNGILDSDQDGVDDVQEYLLGTQRFAADSDNDGLTDGEEMAEWTNPLQKDSDFDGLYDGFELLVLDTDPTGSDLDSSFAAINDEFSLRESQFLEQQAGTTAWQRGDILWTRSGFGFVNSELQADVFGNTLFRVNKSAVYALAPSGEVRWFQSFVGEINNGPAVDAEGNAFIRVLEPYGDVRATTEYDWTYWYRFNGEDGTFVDSSERKYVRDYWQEWSGDSYPLRKSARSLTKASGEVFSGEFNGRLLQRYSRAFYNDSDASLELDGYVTNVFDAEGDGIVLRTTDDNEAGELLRINRDLEVIWRLKDPRFDYSAKLFQGGKSFIYSLSKPEEIWELCLHDLDQQAAALWCYALPDVGTWEKNSVFITMDSNGYSYVLYKQSIAVLDGEGNTVFDRDYGDMLGDDVFEKAPLVHPQDGVVQLLVRSRERSDQIMTLAHMTQREAQFASLRFLSGEATIYSIETTTLEAAIDDLATDGASSVRWVSDIDGELGFGLSIDTVLSKGRHTLTITYIDRFGNTRTKIVIIDVQERNYPPTIRFNQPMADSIYRAGEELAFSADVTDPNGDNFTVEWTSNIDGVLGQGANLQSALSTGNHDITITATDDKGSVASETRVIQVLSVDANDKDFDNDGMVDAWEEQYGLSPMAAEDRYGDADEDGINNYYEFLDGTNPISALSGMQARYFALVMPEAPVQVVSFSDDNAVTINGQRIAVLAAGETMTLPASEFPANSELRSVGQIGLVSEISRSMPISSRYAGTAFSHPVLDAGAELYLRSIAGNATVTVEAVEAGNDTRIELRLNENAVTRLSSEELPSNTAIRIIADKPIVALMKSLPEDYLQYPEVFESLIYQLKPEGLEFYGVTSQSSQEMGSLNLMTTVSGRQTRLDLGYPEEFSVSSGNDIGAVLPPTREFEYRTALFAKGADAFSVLGKNYPNLGASWDAFSDLEMRYFDDRTHLSNTYWLPAGVSLVNLYCVVEGTTFTIEKDGREIETFTSKNCENRNNSGNDDGDLLEAEIYENYDELFPEGSILTTSHVVEAFYQDRNWGYRELLPMFTGANMDKHRDTDMDGLPDFHEARALGLNACVAETDIALIDTDNDGVSDIAEILAGTDALEGNVKASPDEIRCDFSEPDTDRDGVVDSNDFCPATQPGTEVDDKGCEIAEGDADQDGVVDSLDACERTPSGAVVDANGCGLDSDEDGIFDGIDQCPATTLGSLINEFGCADADQDSVADSDDLCPNTDIGDRADADGCSAEQLAEVGLVVVGDASDERIDGSEQDDILKGEGGADTILGYDGNDTIEGGAGNDQLYGFTGDDNIDGGANDDYIVGGNGSGSGSGNDTLNGGAGNDQLNGEDGDDYLIGGSGDDYYIYNANSGRDTLDDQGGGTDYLFLTDYVIDDIVVYRDGNDLLVLPQDDANQMIRIVDYYTNPDNVIEFIVQQGNLIVRTSNLAANAPAYSEGDDAGGDDSGNDDSCNDDSGNDDSGNDDSGNDDSGNDDSDNDESEGDGSSAVDLSGDDILQGSDASDVLLGGAGNDTLIGGQGDDILVGGTGDDTYVIGSNNGADTIVDSSGVNVISFVDGLGFNDVASGLTRSSDDLILRLSSTGGSVRIVNFFTLANTFDSIQFESGGQITVGQLYGAFGVSAPTQTADAGDVFIGAAADDELIGGAGDDVLYGEQGSDVLAGGEGNDLLLGGQFDDIYRITANPGADQIIDYDGFNILRFDSESGITRANFFSAMTKMGNDDNLYIAVGDNGRITITDFFGAAETIDVFEFADGQQFTAAQIIGAYGLPVPTEYRQLNIVY